MENIRQAKLEAGISDLPYTNGNVLQSTTDIPFDPRSSDSELPLTANFAKDPSDSSYQQWDNSGRAVGYAPDPTLYAPQPRKLARVPTAGSSQASSKTSSPAPYMSERNDGYRTMPVRQNTSSSTASWDVAGQVGGPNAYPMSHQTPYQDPYAAAQTARLPPPPAASQLQHQYSQNAPPMRSVGNSSVTPNATGNYPPPEQTPTQAHFAEASASSTGSGTRESVLPNPYTMHEPAVQYAPPLGPPPSQQQQQLNLPPGEYYTGPSIR